MMFAKDSLKGFQVIDLFVLRFYRPVNPMGMLSAVSLPNHMFTGQA